MKTVIAPPGAEGRKSFVLLTDWSWLSEHANPNTDEKNIQRWTCKVTGKRIYAKDVKTDVVGQMGELVGKSIVMPHCSHCKAYPPSHGQQQKRRVTTELVAVQEEK